MTVIKRKPSSQGRPDLWDLSAIGYAAACLDKASYSIYRGSEHWQSFLKIAFRNESQSLWFHYVFGGIVEGRLIKSELSERRSFHATCSFKGSKALPLLVACKDLMHAKKREAEIMIAYIHTISNISTHGLPLEVMQQRELLRLELESLREGRRKKYTKQEYMIRFKEQNAQQSDEDLLGSLF